MKRERERERGMGREEKREYEGVILLFLNPNSRIHAESRSTHEHTHMHMHSPYTQKHTEGKTTYKMFTYSNELNKSVSAVRLVESPHLWVITMCFIF